ncbi:MAG: amidohydrolase family protein [Chloroflexi bacterium]|nr:amidohydrolase family protein [Chloroflexota bacterium]
MLRQAHEAGVEIICGTNAASKAGNVLLNALNFQRVGLSSLDVLRAATQNGAQALKPYVESGSFRSHHMADLFFVQQKTHRRSASSIQDQCRDG